MTIETAGSRTPHQPLPLPLAWGLALLPPLLVVGLIWLLVEGTFGVPAPLASKSLTCFQETPSQVVRGVDNAIVVSSPRPAKPVSFQDCKNSLGTRLAEQAPAAELRARAVLGVTFAVGLAFSAALVVISLFTVRDFRGWGHAGVVLGVAVAFFFLPMLIHWLPHQATLDLISLLDALPDNGAAARQAGNVAWYGCGIVVGLAALYTLTLHAIAWPLPGDAVLRGRLDREIDDLAKRFERLTAISYLGALAFVLSLMTLVAMLQWPLSLATFGPVPGNTATALITMFGAYLTAVLTASYVPAAIVLERQAEHLAHLALNPARLQDALAAARAAVANDHADVAEQLTNLQTGVATLKTLLDARREADPKRACRLVAALRNAGLDPDTSGIGAGRQRPRGAARLAAKARPDGGVHRAAGRLLPPRCCRCWPEGSVRR